MDDTAPEAELQATLLAAMHSFRNEVQTHASMRSELEQSLQAVTRCLTIVQERIGKTTVSRELLTLAKSAKVLAMTLAITVNATAQLAGVARAQRADVLEITAEVAEDTGGGSIPPVTPPGRKPIRH